EAFRSRIPAGDPELGRLLVDQFEEGARWLAEQGVEMSSRLEGLFGSGIGYQLKPDMPTAVRTLVERAVESGVEFRYNTGLVGASVGTDGRVCSVQCLTVGKSYDISTGSLILCTGGYQG